MALKKGFDPRNAGQLAASRQNASARTGMVTKPIHPLNTKYVGTFPCLLSFNDGPTSAMMNIKYRDEYDLYDKVRTYVQERAEAVNNSRMALKKKIDEMKDAGAAAYVIAKNQARLDGMNDSVVYAVQHVVTGKWKNEYDYQMNNPVLHGIYVNDRAFIRVFNDVKEVEALNKQIEAGKKLNDEQFGEEFYPYWVIIEGD